MKFKDEMCPGCGKTFQEKDDIVVCPECGTPQHRACFTAEKKCVNEHLHKDGFEWKPEHPDEELQEKPETMPCPFCGYENHVDSKRCENCGQPFEIFGTNIMYDAKMREEKPETIEYKYKAPFQIEYDRPQQEKMKAKREIFIPFIGSEDGNGNYLYKDVALEPTVLGEDSQDFAIFVRTNVKTYYKKFKRFEKGSKFSFNFCAFLFGGYWYFFRKMWKPGILFTTVMLSLIIAFSPTFTNAVNDYNYIAEKMNEAVKAEDADTAQQERILAEFTQEIEEYTEKYMEPTVLFCGLILVNQLAAGFLADELYKKRFKETVAPLHRINCTVEVRFRNFARTGGISIVAPILAYFAVYAIEAIVSRMIM